jgi:ABC-2 type transport system permease protein
MLRVLIQMLGADYEQWHALTSISIKQDLRSATLGMPVQQQSEGKGNIALRMFARLWVYIFIGGILSGLVWMNKDVFFTGTLLVAYNMVMIALMVLIDFVAVVISPEDFAILGYQPIDSRTFFISRLTNIFLYTTLLSLAIGILPIIAFFFTLGFNPLLGIASLVAVLLSSITAALFLVLIYAEILKVIHPNKLRRVVSYIQLTMSFLIYGGYMFLPQILEAKHIKTMTLTKPVWLLLFPPTWFVSFLDLARGRWQLFNILAALISIAVLVVLLFKVQGKIALDYADRLSSITTVSEGPKTKSLATNKPGRFFNEGESRAVSLLVRNQFKYDQKFRMAVLGILPLTIIYLFMGLRHGPLLDPFITGAKGFSSSWFLYLSVLMVPIILKMSLTQSDSYKASWIYYASPSDQSRIVLASRNCVFAYFVVPYLALLAAIFLYFYHNLLHVLVHGTILALISFIFLQLAVFIAPALPFSTPQRKAQRTSSIFIIMALGPFIAIGLLYLLVSLVYPNKPLLFAVTIGLAGISYLFEILLRKRIRASVASMEYQG